MKHSLTIILLFVMGTLAGGAILFGSKKHEQLTSLLENPDRSAVYQRLAEIEKIDLETGLIQARLIDTPIGTSSKVIFRVTPETVMTQYDSEFENDIITRVTTRPIVNIAELIQGTHVLVVLSLDSEGRFVADSINAGDPFPLP